MIRRGLLCCLVLFWAVEARAQTVTDERVWFGVTVQEAASSEMPWRWTVETVGRSRDGVRDLDTFLVRPSLMYALTAHASLGGGYAFGPNFPATGGTIVEQRIFGQFIWTGAAAGGTLSMRTRMESRFIEGNSGPLGRLRQQVRFIHVVKQGSRVSVVAYDEFAVHVNSTSRSPRGVDQNRAFGGVSLAATQSLRVEGGYLNQFLPGHRGAPDRMNHILSSTVVISF